MPGLGPAPTARPRVLLVDDDERLLRAASRQLRDVDVTTATGGPDALRVLDGGAPFEVVVSDFHMPSMDGATFLGCVADRHPLVSRFLLTGAADLDVAVSAVETGRIMGFLRKPTAPGQLQDAVDRGVERHRSAQREQAEVTRLRAAEEQRRAFADARLESVQAQVAAGFEIHYQPIRRLLSGERVGVEALSRFPSGSPAAWFDLAHEVGLGPALELRAVELALADRPKLGAAERLWVNASPSLLGPALGAALADLHPGVALELSEAHRIDDYAKLADALWPFREEGVLLAIDDAGAGYASMRHIASLQPEFIKLDRALVTGIHADPVRAHLVRAIVSFAHDIGAVTLGEGIEEAPEAERLAELGVELGQGYLLGRPAPRSLLDAGSDEGPVTLP